MNSIYVDINANNSNITDNEFNNEWNYKLNGGMNLPTGTTINLQTSFINKKGIVGQTIEITEDILEKVVFGYYQIETFQEQVVKTLAAVNATTKQFDVLYNPMTLYNINNYYGNLAPSKEDYVSWNPVEMGNSENPMPLMGLFKNPNYAGHNIIPIINNVDIVIKKGVYSVSSLADIISNILNGNIQSSDNKQSNIEISILTNDMIGLSTNFTTQAVFKYNDSATTKTYLETTVQEDRYGTKFDNAFTPMTHTGFDYPKNGSVIPTAIAVRPRDAEKFFQGAIINPRSNWGDQQLTDPLTWENIGYDSLIVEEQQTDTLLFSLCINVANAATVNNADYSSVGYYAGASNAVIQYDNSSSHFTVSGFGEPRRQPTHSKTGESMPDPSKESIYVRRYLPKWGGITFGNASDDTDANKQIIANCLSTPMTRTGGIYVRNWAYTTANTYRTSLTVNSEGEPYFSYDDYFADKQDAVNTWKKTIWYKLGFSYDQLQNSNKWEKSKLFFDEPETLQGFTTTSKITPSAVPFIANDYNPVSGGDVSGDAKPAGQWTKNPSFGTMQCFNPITDINVPNKTANNNSASPNIIGDQVVVPFNSSFYNANVNIPIVSSEIPTEAEKLPTLSNTGYLLITSKSFQSSDIVGLATPSCILDIVPVSSLSNEDFISNRNDLTHTLTNPITLNSINITILKPDLTAPLLDNNSSVLLKITYPSIPPTNIMANAMLSFSENQLAQNTQNEIQEEEQANAPKATKKATATQKATATAKPKVKKIKDNKK